MDGQLKALKEEMLCGQEEVTEKAVKRARREREYPFKRKGKWEQFVFNDSIADKLEFAKQQLNPAQHGGASTSVSTLATEKAVQAIEEGLALIEDRQKLIKLADRSDTGWLMVAEYQEDELAEDSDDEKRIEKAEKRAERKLLKKRKGAGKGKAPVMPDKARGGWAQQRSTAGQWQLGQQAPLTPWRSLGKQPTGLARPIGPCFACGELGHLRHQCRKAGPSLAPAASHRSYPCSSMHVENMSVVSGCSNVHMVSSDVQDAECRSIVGEVSSKTR